MAKLPFENLRRHQVSRHKQDWRERRFLRSTDKTVQLRPIIRFDLHRPAELLHGENSELRPQANRKKKDKSHGFLIAIEAHGWSQVRFRGGRKKILREP